MTGIDMNERIEKLATECYQAPEFDYKKFAELLLKDAFTIIKESMIGEDMTVVEEIIADRLDYAAGDVCDQLGLFGPIYEG
jgi:hypothetical protein